MLTAAVVSAGSKAIGALGSIYGDIRAMKTYKKLAKAKGKLISEKKQTLEQRSKYNEQEIMKAFEENYKRTAFAYGEKIRGIVSQKSQVAGEATAKATINLSNVDIQGSSFHNSQMMELNTEFQAATNSLIYNQSQALLDLAAEKETALTQNKLGMIEANKQFGMESWQIKNDAEQAIKGQIKHMIQGIAPAYKSGKEFGKELKNSKGAKKDGPSSFSGIFDTIAGGLDYGK
ncbi:MAG: hypothetical protein ACRDDH_09325 [Cetobacterium sp.]|uniref:hypothetical protein n=1 Tax=Cetobacterium sp. TaxID=2071632 RepID=UPI003EE5F94D